jgi:hypothetical protein
MTSEAFKRLRVGMAMYCMACDQPHIAERRHLWLEADGCSLGQPPPDEIARDLRGDNSPRDPIVDSGLQL